MDTEVVLIIVGAVLIAVGTLVTIAGIIVARTSGREAEGETPSIWHKIVDWLLDKLGGLIEKVLKGSVTALGLILILLGAASILGGALIAANNGGSDPPSTTTTTTSTIISSEASSPG